ncbi:unnamed protein product [Gadus morhua 'NCC']
MDAGAQQQSSKTRGYVARQRVICSRRGQAGLSHRTVLPLPSPGMGLAVSVPVMEKDSLKFEPSLCEAGCKAGSAALRPTVSGAAWPALP